MAGPRGRLLQAQGVPTPTGMSLTGVGVAFPRSGFGSAVSWYSAIPHPVSAVTAAASKLACVPYVTAVWGTSQSSSSPQSFVELPTPNRDERGAKPRRSTPLRHCGCPPPSYPCLVALLGGQGEQPHSPRSLSLLGWGPGRWPQGVPVPTRVSPPHPEPTRSLATVPTPSLLGASPRHPWSQGLPPLTQAPSSAARPGVLSSGISPAGLGLPQGQLSQRPSHSRHTSLPVILFAGTSSSASRCSQLWPLLQLQPQGWGPALVHLGCRVPHPGCHAAGDPPLDELKENLQELSRCCMVSQGPGFVLETLPREVLWLGNFFSP